MDDLVPPSFYEHSGDPARQLLGKELVAAGRVGCVILAGGEGTRLGSSLPKAFFPIAPVSRKSLLHIFCERAKQSGKNLPLAVMTSPKNHEEMKAYLKENAYFGLNPSQIAYFSQSTLPFLDQEGNPCVNKEGQFVEGPDGNGSFFSAFASSGTLALWKALGVQYVHVVLIDNPLADPFDPELAALHQEKGNEVTLKATLRRTTEERVGVIGKKKGKICVVEYTEAVLEKERFPLANTSLFCFSLSFLEKAANKEFPLQKVKKEIVVDGQKKEVWKQEKFIFHVLELAEKVSVLVYPREECFAPLKNATGEDSVETVQAALRSKKIL